MSELPSSPYARIGRASGGENMIQATVGAAAHSDGGLDSLSAAKASKVLERLSSGNRVGVQLSVFGVPGMPAEGLNDLRAANLTEIEEALAPSFLGGDVGKLALIHRDGLTFEIVERDEALLYRYDRKEKERSRPFEVLPEVAQSSELQAALKKTVVMGGCSSEPAVEAISQLLGVPPYHAVHQKFANSESFVKLPESIRGKHVILVQSFVADVDIALASTKLLLDAASRASAEKITLVMPYFPYARQDRRGAERAPIAPAALLAELNAAARGRLDRIVTVDMHSLQLEGMSGNINVDNLSGSCLFIKPLQQVVGDREFTVVYPDSSARKRANEDGFDALLERAFPVPPKVASMAKMRGVEKNAVKESRFEGDPDSIKGRLVVLVDDMYDTGTTTMETVKKMIALGATEVVSCGTHPIFSRGAVERFRNTHGAFPGEERRAVSKLISCDTIPLRRGKGDLIEEVSVYPMLAHFLAGVVSHGGFSTRELAERYSRVGEH